MSNNNKMNKLVEFIASEDGAVTVDWVVLTAALVGIALAVLASVTRGIENTSGLIEEQLMVDHVTTAF